MMTKKKWIQSAAAIMLGFLLVSCASTSTKKESKTSADNYSRNFTFDRAGRS